MVRRVVGALVGPDLLMAGHSVRGPAAPTLGHHPLGRLLRVGCPSDAESVSSGQRGGVVDRLAFQRIPHRDAIALEQRPGDPPESDPMALSRRAQDVGRLMEQD
jgi:hypothetical protein